jgi:hypothetical protein
MRISKFENVQMKLRAMSFELREERQLQHIRLEAHSSPLAAFSPTALNSSCIITTYGYENFGCYTYLSPAKIIDQLPAGIVLSKFWYKQL